ncbi:hypothetical protein M569_06727 [Genlisea aurea]|uniref:Midasin n=1 Tax=Genlisea aurea TaxID=192259 RepID=S8DXN7_9LAMI|nr:hypothetical protein M569_06727 [Genlisea aurea]
MDVSLEKACWNIESSASQTVELATASMNKSFEMISLAVSQRWPVLLYGPSGSGKSSLINNLAHTQRRKVLSIYMDEQTDGKTLIGSYVCTEQPGEFQWQPGSLTQAVKNGFWVVFEDIDKSPPDIFSILVPLLEGAIEFSTGHGEAVKVNDDFRLFATVTSSIPGTYPNMEGASWMKVMIDAPNHSDLLNIMRVCYPELEPLSGKLIETFETANQLTGSHLGLTTSKFNGRFTLRDLLKFSKRVASISVSLDGISSYACERIFTEAVDVFASFSTSEMNRLIIMKGIAKLWAVSEPGILYPANKPVIQEFDRMLQVGRVVLRHAENVLNCEKKPFVNIRASLYALERIACSVQHNEPVLLVGETGTGKTTLVQTLASRLGQKLIVLNLSQQSDVADLLGGFKPTDARFVCIPLYKEFEILFTNSFSSKDNQGFLSQLRKFVTDKNWKMLLNGFHKGVRKIVEIGKASPGNKRKRTDVLLQAWESFSTKLEKARAQVSASDGMVFSFVEGAFITALRNGDWILLDEVNLAPPEILQRVIGVLDNEKGSLCLAERGDIDYISRHSNFRMFACMNPATDAGKRDLAYSIRSRFTEYYVDDALDDDDLALFVECFTGNDSSCTPGNIVRFYKDAKRSEERLQDGANQRPHFSLRSLYRAMEYLVKAKRHFGFERSLYDGFSMFFLNMLDDASSKSMNNLICKHLLSVAVAPQPLPFDSYLVNKAGPHDDDILTSYVLTKSVKEHLRNLAQAVFVGRYPVLLQGPTSSGKTSLVKFLAAVTGHEFVRINNHEHTDLQEYLGSYTSDSSGKLLFQEGALVKAVRKGQWVVLDELNLAPSDVLEALNRLLDDNRELFVPEIRETIRCHPDFMLFATQNPPGFYGGRKILSRAFRNRFMEIHVDDIPQDELTTILERKCQIPGTCAGKMVNVMKELQLHRQSSKIFSGKHGYITPRDLFRWAKRFREFATTRDLVLNGYYLMAERLRDDAEKRVVKDILERCTGLTFSDDELYKQEREAGHHMEAGNCMQHVDNVGKIIWTKSLQRAYFLVERCYKMREPVLLIGETGGGKTTVCQLLSTTLGSKLHILNCHQYTETSDFLGGFYPVRERSGISADFHNLTQSLACSKAFRNYPGDTKISTDINQASQTLDLISLVVKYYKDGSTIFTWQDGPLIEAMKRGELFLIDEISLADDSVLERLNSVLEPERKLLLAEKGGPHLETVDAHENFFLLATMNPGGDYGKKELSPALRNRFTEIWIPSVSEINDLKSIALDRILNSELSYLVDAMLDFWEVYNPSFDISSIKRLESYGWGDVGCSPVADISENMKCDTLFGIDPFYIEKGTDDTTLEDYEFLAPTTHRNSLRVLRALQLKKPVLLEGSPGVGKTSLIIALGKFSGHGVVRINLSEQTDIMDLFGCDLPVESDEGIQFAWSDGILLQALKKGSWVLLDELNLAPQSVLEGLNAILDHRAEVFIPELGKSFKCPTSFRVFGCQNPSYEGGGRKGLPKSFLNRFTKVYVDELIDDDYVSISASKRSKPACFLSPIYLQRMRTAADRKEVLKLYEQTFGVKPFVNKYPRVMLDSSSLCVGTVSIERNLCQLSMSSRKLMILPAIRNTLEAVAHCVRNQWLCILVGPASSGKTSLIRLLAELTGNTLNELNLSSTTDISELLGCFEQYNVFRHYRLVIAQVERYVNEFCNSISSSAGAFSGNKVTVARWLAFLSDIDRSVTCIENTKMRDAIRQLILILECLGRHTCEQPWTFSWSLKDLDNTLSALRKLENDCLKQHYSVKFEWVTGSLVKAIENGEWIVLENANLCNPTVLDRINSLVEQFGSITINECGIVEGNPVVLHPHPRFRMFLTVNPSFGEVSRAMRNRGVEVFMMDPDWLMGETSCPNSYEIEDLQELTSSLKSSLNFSLKYSSRSPADILPHQKILWTLDAWESVTGARGKVASFILQLWLRWHANLWDFCPLVFESQAKDNGILLPFKFFRPLKLLTVDHFLQNPVSIGEYSLHSFNLRAASHNLWQCSPSMTNFHSMLLSVARSLFEQREAIEAIISLLVSSSHRGFTSLIDTYIEPLLTEIYSVTSPNDNRSVGYALFYIGGLRYSLLVASGNLDPCLKHSIKYSILTEKIASLQVEIEVRKECNYLAGTACESDSEFYQKTLLDELNAEGKKMQKKMVFRPNAGKFEELKYLCNDFLKSVNVMVEWIKSLTSFKTEEVASQMYNWQETLSRVNVHLSNEFSAFGDITEPIQVAIYEMKLGLSLMLAGEIYEGCVENSKHDMISIVTSTHELMRFPRVWSHTPVLVKFWGQPILSTQDISLPSNIEALDGLHSFLISTKDALSNPMALPLSLRISFYHHILQRVKYSAAVSQFLCNTSFKLLHEVFDKVALLWIENRMKASVVAEDGKFKFRARTFKMASIIEMDLSNCVNMLPVDSFSEWQELLSEDLDEKIIVNEDEADLELDWDANGSFLGGIVDIHNQLFGSVDLVQRPGRVQISDMDMVSCFLGSYWLGLQVTKDLRGPATYCFDAKLAPVHLLRLCLAHENKLFPSNKLTTMSNFYKDPNSSVIIKLVEPVTQLRHEFLALLKKYDNHPTLLRILEVTDMILALPLDSPLAKALSALEFLLNRVLRLQDTVIKFSTSEHLQPILALVASWHKLEFESWPALLDEVESQIERNVGKLYLVFGVVEASHKHGSSLIHCDEVWVDKSKNLRKRRALSNLLKLLEGFGLSKNRPTMEGQFSRSKTWIRQPSYEVQHLLMQSDHLSENDLTHLQNPSQDNLWEASNKYYFKSIAAILSLEKVSVTRARSYADHLIEIQQEQRAVAYDFSKKLKFLRQHMMPLTSLFSLFESNAKCFPKSSQLSIFKCLWRQKQIFDGLCSLLREEEWLLQTVERNHLSSCSTIKVQVNNLCSFIQKIIPDVQKSKKTLDKHLLGSSGDGYVVGVTLLHPYGINQEMEDVMHRNFELIKTLEKYLSAFHRQDDERRGGAESILLRHIEDMLVQARNAEEQYYSPQQVGLLNNAVSCDEDVLCEYNTSLNNALEETSKHIFGTLRNLGDRSYNFTDGKEDFRDIRKWKFLFEKDIKRLQLELISSNVSRTVRCLGELLSSYGEPNISLSPSTHSKLRHLYFLFEKILSFGDNLLMDFLRIHSMICEVTYGLSNAFSSLFSKGFGGNEDVESTKEVTKEGSGTGMGEGAGMADVSEQINDEDQLLGASSGKQNEDHDSTSDLPDKNEKGIEMEQDFDAEAFSVSEDSEPEENGDTEGDEPESAMGEVGDNSNVVDEKVDHQKGDNDEDNEKYEQGPSANDRDSQEDQLRAKEEESTGAVETSENNDPIESADEDNDAGEKDGLDNCVEDMAVDKNEAFEDPSEEQNRSSDEAVPPKDESHCDEQTEDGESEDLNDTEMNDGEENIDQSSKDVDAEQLAEDDHEVADLDKPTSNDDDGITKEDSLQKSNFFQMSNNNLEQPAFGDGAGQLGGQPSEAEIDATNSDDPNASEFEVSIADSRNGERVRNEQRSSTSLPRQESPSRNLDTNPYRSIGSAIEGWKERVKVSVDLQKEEDMSEDCANDDAEEYGYTAEFQEGTAQALGPAMADQIKDDIPQNESENDSRGNVQKDAEDKARIEKSDPETLLAKNAALNHGFDAKTQHAAIDQEMQDAAESMDMDVDHDKIESGSLESFISVRRSYMSEEMTQFASQSNDDHLGNSRKFEPSADLRDSAAALWRKYESNTTKLSHELVEQLRLVMEPTTASKLQGDYKTGKKINMKKVIPYIASHYRKDKIWQRRTRPSKRDYQVVIAVDDSRSMSEGNCGDFALEALVTVCRAMSQLEVGDLAVASFGKQGNIKLLHDFDQPFTPEAGIKMISSLSFEQENTIVDEPMADLLKYLDTMLEDSAAKRKFSGRNPLLLQQLVLIVADGRFNEKDRLKRYVRDVLNKQQRMVAFLVLDSPNESIVDLMEARVEEKKGVTVCRYMDEFPFPYYVVLKKIEALPRTVADLLRQWFELMHNSRD